MGFCKENFNRYHLAICVCIHLSVTKKRNDIWHIKIDSKPPVFYTFDLQMCFVPQPRALVRHLDHTSTPNMWWFQHFDSKYALRHKGVQFVHISTSKSAPGLMCFVRFYFHMCFAPQRRALLPHPNVHWWVRSAIHRWFALPFIIHRHRLARYYWYSL